MIHGVMASQRGSEMVDVHSVTEGYSDSRCAWCHGVGMLVRSI